MLRSVSQSSHAGAERSVSQRAHAGAELRRTISLPWLVLYGLGTTIGAGVYALTGVVAGRAGMQAPVAFLWLPMAFLYGIGGSVLAAIGGMAPDDYWLLHQIGRGLALQVGGLQATRLRIESSQHRIAAIAANECSHLYDVRSQRVQVARVWQYQHIHTRAT